MVSALGAALEMFLLNTQQIKTFHEDQVSLLRPEIPVTGKCLNFISLGTERRTR